MQRPRQLIGVLGTHTEVGKTWIAVRLLGAARRSGLRVAARKPVQSHAPQAQGPPTDAELLAEASGEHADQVCSPQRTYELAMAPPMAADCLGRPRILLASLLQEITWPADLDLGLVESVGGPRSPTTHDADSMQLIERLEPDRVLLVADAGLGTINAILLSLTCIRGVRVDVVLNRFDPKQRLHQLNRTWLMERHGIHTCLDAAELLR